MRESWAAAEDEVVGAVSHHRRALQAHGLGRRGRARARTRAGARARARAALRRLRGAGPPMAAHARRTLLDAAPDFECDSPPPANSKRRASHDRRKCLTPLAPEAWAHFPAVRHDLQGTGKA
jgi:hypothetical protein